MTLGIAEEEACHCAVRTGAVAAFVGEAQEWKARLHRRDVAIRQARAARLTSCNLATRNGAGDGDVQLLGAEW
jgi:hypothetical protein